jgi:protoporphyrin/coproporphyrin ferrochelatase
MSASKRAIVLMNLGSPDSTEVKDVRKYLDQFLMDERVIDKPWLLRALLVKGIIVPFRAPKSSAAYKRIWTDDGSPLITISKKQRDLLQEIVPEQVEIAMRYGSPSPADAFKKIVAAIPSVEEVVLLPMYPHYAMSSFETAVEYAKLHHSEGKFKFKLKVVDPFYNDESYLDALTESIRPHLQKPFDLILFSYHGIPERHVQKTDPTGNHCLKVNDCCKKTSPAHAFCYRHQCFTSTELITSRLLIPPNKVQTSFQSRLGRDEWLKPYTAQRLEELPGEGIKKLIVVCPAFVSDCLETLEEIAMEGRESFLHAGGETFELIPCLNTDPLWISAMAKLVHSEVELKVHSSI